MKNTFWLAFMLMVCISLLGCTTENNKSQPPKAPPQENQQQTGNSNEAIVENLVKEFGGKLKSVSLLAPADVVKESIQENYINIVSPALLAQWQANPQEAPGRMLSSPWPDRIEIITINKLSTDNGYEVTGEVIEVTSAEEVNGGVAAKRPITLVVKEIEGRWLIDAATMGEYGEGGSIVYRNTEYGFSFHLPDSWEGYEIINEKWEGFKAGQQGGEAAETGPMISIRHPQWTAQNPRQDIPILIFNLAQWDLLQQREFHIGAAPIGPKKIGRSNNYVFALPARYNYAFPTGYEEVEKILENEPLKPLE